MEMPSWLPPQLHGLLPLAEPAIAARTLPFSAAAALICIGHVLSLSNGMYGVLSLSPWHLLSLQVWRLFSAPFVGRNLIVFLASLASIHAASRILAQAHSPLWITKTLLVTQVVSTAAVSVIALSLYASTGLADLLFSSALSGFTPSIAAILVLIKQLLPDSIVVSTPLGRVKYTHLPMCSILLTGLLSLVGGVRGSVALEMVVATQVAWTWLRFYATTEGDADLQVLRGDPNEHFAWPTLFPSAARPFCSLLAKAAFRPLARLGLCNKEIRHVDASQLGASAPLPSLIVVDSSNDSKRRRQKALLALNQRLQQQAPDPRAGADWSDHEEEEVVTRGTLATPLPPLHTVDDASDAPDTVVSPSPNLQHFLQSEQPSAPSVS